MRGSCDMYMELDIEKCIKDGIKIFVSSNDVVLTSGINRAIPINYFRKVKNDIG